MRHALIVASWILLLSSVAAAGEPVESDSRRPADDAELRQWLENMIWYHEFSAGEIQAATGLSRAEIEDAQARFGIRPGPRPERPADAPLLVLPYPGGRHPRIGFLDGAVRPQRETKLSVFAPWDASSYVVIDLPEAIWSNLGLTYLAHTHVPTLWTEQGTELEPLEWQREGEGHYMLARTLPNGIRFTTRAQSDRAAVRMEMELYNGTTETLSDLSVQMCVMLKGARGFEAQDNGNKVFQSPYAACRNRDGRRWVIAAWEPCQRTWANERCPCLHSDPQFADCPPEETRRLRGWLSFYEGDDIAGEFRRIDATGWRDSTVE